MIKYTTPLLLSLLLLLPIEASGRQWNLPASRVVTPQVIRHDFYSKHRQHSELLPAVVGLKGGETTPAPDEDDEKMLQTMADGVARGGGATTTIKPAEVVQPQLLAEHEVSLGNSTVTATTDAVTNAEKKAEKKAKKRKEKFHKKIAKKLKNRNATNLRRKVMHASFGLFFASLNHLIPKKHFVPGMAVLSSATLLMELLRYRKRFGWMNKALHFVLGGALRKHEMDGKFTGSFYFFTGVTLTAALFPTSSATLGIIQLAIADPSASYFGRATRHVYWSRIENGLGGLGRNKGFLGFLGGAACCFPFNYRILSIAKFGADGVPGGQASLALASLALGMAGAFADLAVPTPALTMPKKIWGVKVPPLHLDDNFVVPMVSGYACTQVFKVLGWHQNLELARFIFI